MFSKLPLQIQRYILSWIKPELLLNKKYINFDGPIISRLYESLIIRNAFKNGNAMKIRNKLLLNISIRQKKNIKTMNMIQKSFRTCTEQYPWVSLHSRIREKILLSNEVANIGNKLRIIRCSRINSNLNSPKTLKIFYTNIFLSYFAASKAKYKNLKNI